MTTPAIPYMLSLSSVTPVVVVIIIKGCQSAYFFSLQAFCPMKA